MFITQDKMNIFINEVSKISVMDHTEMNSEMWG